MSEKVEALRTVLVDSDCCSKLIVGEKKDMRRRQGVLGMANRDKAAAK